MQLLGLHKSQTVWFASNDTPHIIAIPILDQQQVMKTYWGCLR